MKVDLLLAQGEAENERSLRVNVCVKGRKVPINILYSFQSIAYFDSRKDIY